MSLPCPCRLCGHTCTSRADGVVRRRLDGGLFAPREKPKADLCHWRQCPHRRPVPPVPLVIEDQNSHAVVRVPRSATPDDPVTAITLHPDHAAATADAARLHQTAVDAPGPQTETFDVVRFPHALIAGQLAGFQEEGFEAGYEHARDTFREQLLEDLASPLYAEPGNDALPAVLAAVFDVPPHVAHAAAWSVRRGHPLDSPLCNALAETPNPTGDAP